MEERIDPATPKFLGKQTGSTTDVVDMVPWNGHGPIQVEFHCKDFTSHCPVTGQPDFAELSIVYAPGEGIIETKSLKMFLQSYRDMEQFNERIVDDIAEKLFSQSKCNAIKVVGRFAYRGGISVTATAERAR